MKTPLINSGGHRLFDKKVTASFFLSFHHSKTLLTNFDKHKWPSKKVTASYFSSFCHLKIPWTNSGEHRWRDKKITALCFSSFCHLEIAFGKMISSIRLQKKDLGRIFHYVYKYKITIYIGGLSFHQSSDLKTAIATSLYITETFLLSMGGLGHTLYWKSQKRLIKISSK